MSRFKSMHLLPVAVAAMLTGACSKTPGNVLPPEEMSKLIADVYRGESVIEFNHAKYSSDSMKKVVKQSVLMAHNVDEAKFDSSMVWYGRHIEEYIKVCDRAVEMLEAEAEAIPDDPQGMNQLLVAGDSAQVWPMSNFYHITSATPTRYITFRLTPDDNWEKGDEYALAFKLINIRSDVKSLLATDYTDGRSEYLSTTQTEDGWSRITLRLDTARTAKAVYGFIEFDPTTGEHIYVDSISLVRTRINSKVYRSRNRQKIFDHGQNINND